MFTQYITPVEGVLAMKCAVCNCNGPSKKKDASVRKYRKLQGTLPLIGCWNPKSRSRTRQEISKDQPGKAVAFYLP